MFVRQGIFLVVLAALALAGCNRGETSPPAASIEGADAPTRDGAAAPTEAAAAPTRTAKKARPKPKENLFPEVLIKTKLGDIRVRLNAEKAPVTVDNFLSNYVRRRFYNDTLVHYVAADKMIIAGGYAADLQPKEAGAPILNEATNGLKNKRGTVAMIRDPDYSQSATSQFFFNLADNTELDHESTDSSEKYGYCVFGEVISGMEVIEAIAKVQVHDQGDLVSTPVEPLVIQSVEHVK
jgi:peptidyl-prolyl cis-trans isomerase A (cyclophilin A)